MMVTPGCKSAKAMAYEGDRISGLPDELLHHVMSFLPARDAVRTCVLSPRWRHLWATAHSLNINAKGFTTPGDFIDFVTTFLLRRGCAPLESFSLRANERPIILQNFCDTANLWISHALWCKVQELAIVNHDGGGSRRAGFRLHHQPFTSKYLKRLHLSYVLVDSPLLKALFSGCLVLEDLKMTYCEIFATQLSSVTLKNLTVDHSNFHGFEECEDFHGIVINMPSLVSLYLISLSCPKLILVGVQSLVTATIFLGYLCPVKLPDVCDILGALSHVKNLELLFLGYVGRQYSRQSDMQLCQMVFTNLQWRSLEQIPEGAAGCKTTFRGGRDWCLHNDCKVLLRMLQHSPNLEILILKLATWSYAAAAAAKTDLLCEGTTTPFSCEKLKKIEIRCGRANKGAGILAKLLYANIFSPGNQDQATLGHTT